MQYWVPDLLVILVSDTILYAVLKVLYVIVDCFDLDFRLGIDRYGKAWKGRVALTVGEQSSENLFEDCDRGKGVRKISL